MTTHLSADQNVHIGDNGLYYIPVCTRGMKEPKTVNATFDVKEVTCNNCLEAVEIKNRDES